MHCEINAVAMANAAGEVVLLETEQCSEILSYQVRGYFVAGSMTFRDGQCQAKWERTEEAYLVMPTATQRFAELVAEILKQRTDFKYWREKVLHLPDVVMN